MSRILVVDDHAIVRHGVRQLLAGTPEKHLVGDAANANEAIRKLRAERWDLVLMDVNLPGKNGLEALKQIRIEWPAQKVLIFSVDPEECYALRALRAGAAGYLTKTSPPEMLLTAIRRIVAGGKYITQSLAEKLASVVGTNLDRPPHENLTDREFQIFGMLAAGKTVSQVADELSLSVKTISTHRSKVLYKLGLRNNAELIHYHIRQIPRSAMAIREESA
ncbi:MAG: response regulator transcription factor [Chromatiales bacterium]|nr:response regulator transcription factor [Chromatiales bacterium]